MDTVKNKLKEGGNIFRSADWKKYEQFRDDALGNTDKNPESFDTIASRFNFPAWKEYLKELQVISLPSNYNPTDDFPPELKNKINGQPFIALHKNQYYYIDPQGYDYSRYVGNVWDYKSEIDEIIPFDIELKNGGTVKFVSLAPEGTVFVKINSHRASDYVKRTRIPNISFWNLYVSGSAGQSVHLINESDYNKIKDITGVSEPLKQLKSPGQIWHPRLPLEGEQKQKYDPNTDLAENKKLYDAYENLNEEKYADGGVMEKYVVKKIQDRKHQVINTETGNPVTQNLSGTTYDYFSSKQEAERVKDRYNRLSTPVFAYYKGEDDWGNELYKGDDGIMYAKVDGSMYTITDEGEPNYKTGKTILPIKLENGTKFTLGGFTGSINSNDVGVITDESGRKRFKIDDTNSEINDHIVYETIQSVEKFNAIISLKLSKILYIWDGYKYYPDLKNIDVEFVYNKSTEYDFLACYVYKSNKIIINVLKLINDYGKYIHYARLSSDKTTTTRTSSSISGDTGTSGGNGQNTQRSKRDYLLRLVRRKLFHELQHAIQKREGIELPPTRKSDVIKYAKVKYGKSNLTDDAFKKWLSENYNTSFESAIYAEYKNIPAEKECFQVEEELDKFKHGGPVNSATEKFIARYNLHGKDAKVKFKEDPQTYFTKNIHPDRKHIFVFEEDKSGGRCTRDKRIADIVSIDDKPVSISKFMEAGGLVGMGSQILARYHDKLIETIVFIKEELADTTPSPKEDLLKTLLLESQDKLHFLIQHAPDLLHNAQTLRIIHEDGGPATVDIENIDALKKETKQLSDAEVIQLYPVFFEGKEITESKITHDVRQQLAKHIFESTKELNMAENIADIKFYNGGKIKLNEQHDYMTIRMPNGNFTGSFSGFKASGGLVLDKTGAFDRMVKFVEDVSNGKTFGDRMRKLADEKVMSKIWPQWNTVVENPFGIGDKVIMPFKPKYGTGVITEIKKKNVVVQFPNQPIFSVSHELLEKAGKLSNGGKSHSVKKYLTGGEIGTPQWTGELVKQADAFFDLIQVQPTGEDYVRYIQDTLKHQCVSNFSTAQDYYKKWLLTQEESMKNGGKFKLGGTITPHKKVKANQAIAISEVVWGYKLPDGTRPFKDLGPMEAGMLYNLRDKDLNFEMSHAEGLREQIYKKLEDKDYIEWEYEQGTSIDKIYSFSDKAKDFINRVSNRLETRKSVKAGLDLFPETSNIPELEMKNGGVAGESVGDFIFVQKSSDYWQVFNKNGQKMAIITKESYSQPNVLPYLSPIRKREYFLVTSVAGKKEKFETIEDVKKAFREFKLQDGGSLKVESDIVNQFGQIPHGAHLRLNRYDEPFTFFYPEGDYNASEYGRRLQKQYPKLIVAPQRMEDGGKTNNMIPVKTVTIEWAEANYPDELPKEFPDFITTSKYIKDHLELTDVGYDKHKVKAVWTDGENWDERVDISTKENNPTEYENIFAAYILNTTMFYIGLAERGAGSGYLDKEKTKQRAKDYVEFITKYDFQITKTDFDTVLRKKLNHFDKQGFIPERFKIEHYTNHEFINVLEKWLGKDFIDNIDDRFRKSIIAMENGGDLNVQGGLHLPYEISVYVPSTKDVDKQVTKPEMDHRTSEVTKYLADKFGGYTSMNTTGGYFDHKHKLVKEPVIKITSFSTEKDFQRNKQNLLDQIRDWSKEWGQEAVGLEFEGDLYYVSENKKADGGRTTSYIKAPLLENYFITGPTPSFYQGRIWQNNLDIKTVERILSPARFEEFKRSYYLDLNKSEARKFIDLKMTSNTTLN